MTEADKEALMRAGVKYMDITDYPESAVSLQSTKWTPCKCFGCFFLFVSSI